MIFSNRSTTWAPAFAGVTISAAILFSGCAGSKSHLKIGKTADGEVVEAEGLAPDNANDRIATKKASLSDAQRNAVEKVVGVYVSARTFVEKAVAIENNILAKTEGYVKKYDVLNESSENGLYKTKIRALVALKDLEADLKQLSLLKTGELQRPRLAMDLIETVDREDISEHPAQAALQKALMQQGYVIVSGTQTKSADLLIEGKAAAFPFQSDKLGGFVSYRARLAVQAKRPGMADVVCSLTKEASGLGGNEDLAGLKALESVGEFTAVELGEKLAEIWGKGRTLLVMVEGVKSFADVDRVKKHLSSMPGVNDLELRLYDEQMAQFNLLMGSAKPSELATTLAQSQSLPMDVVESSNNVLRLKLK
jgi:hypothetical protein